MRLTEREFDEVMEKASQSKDVVLPDPGLIDSVVLEPLDTDYVLVHNDELTEKYNSWVKTYGYDDFESLYLSSRADFATYDDKVYSRSNEAVKATSKNKDTAKLNLVQRTVMRRGKPTTLSFYQDPNKGTQQSNSAPKAEQGDSEQQDVTGFYTAGDTFGKPDQEKIKEYMPPESWYVSGSTRGKMYDCFYFVNGTQFSTVAGIKHTKGLLTLGFVATPDKDSYYLGFYRSLKKLIYLAYENDMGITYKPKVAEKDLAKALFDYYGIKERSGVYTQKDLTKVLGEHVWKKQ